jgi:hypothetical protein
MVSNGQPIVSEESAIRAGGPVSYFARNLAILTDDAGHVGVGEVHGGEQIRKALHEARELLIGFLTGSFDAILNAVRRRFSDLDSAARGQQAFEAMLGYFFFTGDRKKTGLPYRHAGGRLSSEMDMDAVEQAHALYINIGLESRDDAAAVQYLIPKWQFDPKRPCQ